VYLSPRFLSGTTQKTIVPGLRIRQYLNGTGNERGAQFRPNTARNTRLLHSRCAC